MNTEQLTHKIVLANRFNAIAAFFSGVAVTLCAVAAVAVTT